MQCIPLENDIHDEGGADEAGKRLREHGFTVVKNSSSFTSSLFASPCYDVSIAGLTFAWIWHCHGLSLGFAGPKAINRHDIMNLLAMSSAEQKFASVRRCVFLPQIHS